MIMLKKKTILIVSVLLLVLFYLVYSFFLYDADTIRLGRNFKYDKERQFIYYNDNKRYGVRDIPPLVTNYVYDNEYIIAKQIPKIPLEQIYYDSNEIIYPFGVSGVYYWIIDMKTLDVNGPFDYEEYLRKRKELGVPNKLQLECEKVR